MADTCDNELYLMQALRKDEAPEKIPSFCQSIMADVAQAYFMKHEEDLEDEDILITDVGDLTIYKAFGYSSRWNGSPGVRMKVDDAARDRARELQEEYNAKHGTPGKNYFVNYFGAIRGQSNVGGWFVEAGIKTEKDLRLFLDSWDFKPPAVEEIDSYKRGRQQCLDVDFVPFAGAGLVMEPANQSIYFSLTGKLMRKENPLIDELYDFFTRRTEAQFKAALDAGYKLFVTADDMAYKHGPMISPAYYRKHVVPCAKRVCDLVHDGGGLIFMHTDGWIEPVMDCFINAGYDGIQPLEPTSGMTIELVKKKWGDKIACIGNVDTTYTLPFGTEKEVRAYVHRCFREAGGHPGEKAKDIKGYIFAASGTLHNEVKLDLALAMMDEYKKVRDGLVPV